MEVMAGRWGRRWDREPRKSEKIRRLEVCQEVRERAVAGLRGTVMF